MDKVTEFYARWFAKKLAPEYSAAEEAGELMLNSPGPVAGAILGTVFSRLCEEARAA
jgi:hypothetical protein